MRLSFEKLVIDDELVGSIREWVNADVVNDETLACSMQSARLGLVAVICFFQPHTLRHCRDYEHHVFQPTTPRCLDRSGRDGRCGGCRRIRGRSA